MNFPLKKQIIFLFDKTVSAKGLFPLNLLFAGFPKKIISLKEALAEEKNDIEYKEALGPIVLGKKLPKTIEPKIHSKFTSIVKYTNSKKFVLILRNSRVVLRDCFVITKKDFLVEEINPSMGRYTSQVFYANKFPKLRHFRGKVAVLFNTDNYFHWMFETIPRLLLLKKLGIKPDYFVVGNDKSFKKESLKNLAIASEKIIPANDNLHIFADELVVPSLPINSGNPTPLVCNFLRETFLKKPSKEYLSKYEKIYVARGNVKERKVGNEKEVEDFLSKKGFVSITLDGLSIEEQAKIFASAKVIVAAHGAALSNLAFCRKGTKIIEIFHPDYVNACFWALSNCVELDYYYFLASKHGWIDFSFGTEINLEKLSSALTLAGII